MATLQGGFVGTNPVGFATNSLTIGSAYNMVPPPGVSAAMVPSIASALPMSVPSGILPPGMVPPPGGMVPPPTTHQSGFGAQVTGIPGPTVVGIPAPGIPGLLQSALLVGGTATPPIMMLNGPNMAMTGLMEGAYQADQTGPVLCGPGATKVKEAFKLVKLTSSQNDMLNRAKKYAMEQSIKTVLVKQTIAHQAQQQLNIQSTIQKQQALALMCRIYVGSINFEIKEDTIKQAFQPFGPIKSVNLSWDAVTNKHKGFAFVEYDIPEAAALAMDQMNGVMIGGRNIKVGRPSNMPQAQPIIEQLKEEAKSYNRVYVSSIHPDLNESDVRSVFEAFGPIKSCQLVPEPTKPGKHKGHGFIEYTNGKSAEDAVASMNLFDLGGMFLRVGKAITPPDIYTVPTTVGASTALPTATAVAAAAVTAKLTALDVQQPLMDFEMLVTSSHSVVSPIPPPGLATIVPPVGLATPTMVGGAPLVSTLAPPVLMSSPHILPVASLAQPILSSLSQSVIPPVGLANPVLSTDTHAKQPEMPKLEKEDNSIDAQENLKISGRNARHMVMQRLMRAEEFKVCVLRNMVGPEDLDDDLQHEVEEECSRYGNVQRVIIYQERQGEEADAEVIVKIFVEFSLQQEVENACASLNGRYFGGRIVRAEKYSQILYDANDLSG